jgi:hypothetical protein
VRDKEADVDFKADEEEEQDQSQIGYQIQVWHGCGWENGILKAWYAHHD